MTRELSLFPPNSIIRRVGALLGRMSGEVSAECQRLCAWGALGQATGARLVASDSSMPLVREQLFGKF